MCKIDSYTGTIEIFVCFANKARIANPRQRRGAHAATIGYEILEKLRSHPMTDMSLEWFEKDGKHLYDVEF